MPDAPQPNVVWNKDLINLISRPLNSLKAWSAQPKSPEAILWAFVIIQGMVLIGLFIYYYKASSVFETPANINRIAKASAAAAEHYDISVRGRTGLRAYLQQLKAKGVPDTHLCLTNFYISTVNAAGMFLPAVDSIASPMAIRAAADGGARAFVFDIWPDLTPGAKFAPVIQIVESGSNWRRISMNSIPFVTLMKELVQQCYLAQTPGSEDPVIIYLRFRGKPRDATYSGVAQALQSTMETYRLDSTYYNCRSQDKIFSTPMTSLFKKMIVMSNVKAKGNMLSDYINIGPKDGVKMEWAPNDARGLSGDGQATAIGSIQQNLTIVAPLSEDPTASDNSIDFQTSFNVGIHMVAMNFWNTNDKLKAYMDPLVFGKQSFLIKPTV